MNLRIFFTIFLVWFSFTAQSQLNISFDNECTKRNSAVISKALIELYGENFVGDLLDSNTIIAFFWEIDKLGRVIKSKSFRKFTMPSSVDSQGSRTIYFTDCPVKIPKRFQKKLQETLIRNDIRFEICSPTSERNVEKQKLDAINRYSAEKKIRIVAEFPGQFKYMYYDRKSEDQSLSKIEFLKKQIERYLPVNQ
jgi:hypothetical protein